jgi:hypothetical protein
MMTKSSTRAALCIAHGEATCVAVPRSSLQRRAAIHQETKRMISAKSRLAMALGIAGAIALSMSAAEARSGKRSPAKVQAKVVQGAVDGRTNAYRPSYRGSLNYQAAPMGGVGGGGINFNDGSLGANYNRNQ